MSPCTSDLSSQITCAFYGHQAIQRGINETLAIYGVDAQADMSLCWPHRSYVGFVGRLLISHFAAHILRSCREVYFYFIFFF